MNRFKLKHFAWIIAGATLAFALTGCTIFHPVVDPARFYVLAISEYAPATEEPPEEGGVLGLTRVRVARYLDAPGIAIRQDGNRVVYSQIHRWAESIEHGVSRVLAESLRQEPAVAHVAPHMAQRRDPPDYEVHVSISRAEGVISPAEGTFADFRATWELRAGADGDAVATGEIREDRLPWDGEDFDRLIASLSHGVAELSRQVAMALERTR